MNRFIEESYSLYKDSVGTLNTRKTFLILFAYKDMKTEPH